MDFVQNLDPAKLVSITAGVAFVLTISQTAPSYNLPVLLLGVYAQENAEAIRSIQLFTVLLATSILWDVIWIFKDMEHSGLLKLGICALIILKVPTVMSFAASMRQRGAHFSGVGLGGGDTVWSMPGGFTSGSQDGYQPFGDSRPTPPPPSRAVPSAPTAASQLPPPPPATGGGVPGAYQQV